MSCITKDKNITLAEECIDATTIWKGKLHDIDVTADVQLKILDTGIHILHITAIPPSISSLYVEPIIQFKVELSKEAFKSIVGDRKLLSIISSIYLKSIINRREEENDRMH